MSENFVDYDDDTQAEIAKPLPKKKSFGPPGWAAMDKATKRNVVLFVVGLLFFGWWLMPSSNEETLVVVDETTGDPFAGANVSDFGSKVGAESSNNDLIAQRQQADALDAGRAIENGTSGVQNVTYSSWVAFEDEPEVKADNDRVNAFSPSNSGSSGVGSALNLGEYKSKLTAKLTASKTVYQPSELGTSQNSQSSASPNQGGSQPQNAVRTSSTDQASNSSTVASVKRGILPSDSIPCKLQKAVNTDVSRSVLCDIIKPPLIGGVFWIDIKREADFAYLSATTLTFGDNFAQIAGAVAVDSGDVAANGIRDSVDYHTAMRWSSLFLAGAGSAVTDLVGTPRTSQTTDGTISRTETIKASKKEILIASAARPFELANEQLMANFMRPPTVGIDKDRILYIMFSQPVNEEWLPDMRTKSQHRFKERTW